jgi:hypothetical protein
MGCAPTQDLLHGRLVHASRRADHDGDALRIDQLKALA